MAFTTEQKTEIRERLTAGETRQQLATTFGVTYQAIYAISKGMELPEKASSETSSVTGGTRARVLIDGRPRNEVIRELAASGMTRGEIAKKLDVVYQIVFSALKTGKSKEEGLFEGSKSQTKTPKTPKTASTAPQAATVVLEPEPSIEDTDLDALLELPPFEDAELDAELVDVDAAN